MIPLSRRSALGLAAALALPVAARADQGELRISKQFGISYAPMAIMEARGLVEKHARAGGMGDLKVSWMQLTGGAPTNDALISGNLDIATGGVGPMLTLWARTRSSLKVRALASLNSMPLFLTTILPGVKSVRDFPADARIALPAVGISIQAVTLRMACAQAFGEAEWGRLDAQTVSMGHPDALASMLSGRSEITAHFGSPPFQEQELQDPRVSRVLSSYDVLGGPASFNLAWASTKFMEGNPVLARAFLAGLEEALAMIRDEPRAAAQLWIDSERSRLPPEMAVGILTAPDNVYTTTPQNVVKYAEFMARTGSIKEKPASWRDLFFEGLHDRQGS